MAANRRNKAYINVIKVATTLVKARHSHYGGSYCVALCNLIRPYPNCSNQRSDGAREAEARTGAAKSDRLRGQTAPLAGVNGTV